MEIINCDCFNYFKNLYNQSVDVVFTSPPYNSKRFKKYNKTEHYINYFEFLKKIIDESLRVAKKYVIINLQTNYYNKSDVYKIIGEFNDKIERIVIWSKSNPAPSSLRNRMTSSYELFLIFSNTGSVKCNSIFLKDVIEFPVNSEKISNHNAVMNQNVCDFFIREFTDENDTVFDPFMGTGTTALMCIKNNRKYLGTEIEKEYCDFANERLNRYKKNKDIIQTNMFDWIGENNAT